jgi:hypothetical protein
MTRYQCRLEVNASVQYLPGMIVETKCLPTNTVNRQIFGRRTVNEWLTRVNNSALIDERLATD